MSEPRPLLESSFDSLERSTLESARLERAPRGAAEKALALVDAIYARTRPREAAAPTGDPATLADADAARA